MSTTTPTKLAAFDANNAMLLLWQRASGSMTAEELKWFADGAPELVQFQAEYLSEITMGLGCLIGNDDSSGALSDRHDMSMMLWNVSHQAGMLSALTSVGRDAAHLVQLQQQAKTKGGRAAP
jgi:hypothetical protein